MKSTLLLAGLAFAGTMLAGFASAEEVAFRYLSDETPASATSYFQPESSPSDEVPIGDKSVAASIGECCGSAGCGGDSACACGGCDSCGPLLDECEDCTRIALLVFAGIDSWRGIADGSFQNNNGVHMGFNAGGALNEETGLAWQAGASFGIYDWQGRESFPFEADESEQQTFITAGVFRRASGFSPWSGGIVIDQMIANNFGIFSTEPYLAQVRYQAAYALSECNEVGLWATNELNHDTQVLGPVPFTTRAVNQANLFWHHKFELGADSWFYVGVPTNDRVGAPGRLGDFIFGGMFSAPLNDGLALYGNFAYLDPSAAPIVGSEEDSFNVSLGLAWYPACNARSRTVAGRTWMPYLPVANNGTFLIDQNITF